MNETAPPRPTLVRGLGPYMAVAVVVGTVIGSGVFKKPQVVAQNLPDLTWVAVAWIMGGVLAIMGALALAEVAVLYPRAGGNYVFLREGYGRWAGFLWGWVEFLIIRTASIAALATMFTESFRDILKEATGIDDPLQFWGEKGMTMSVILVLAIVNVRGVRWGGGLQLAITVVKVASLLGIMVLPWVILGLGRSFPEFTTPSITNVPAEITLSGFLTAFVGVIWAYHGWMNITPVAEEIRNPQRNIPLALLGGVGIVMFVYLGANFAYHQVLPMWVMAQRDLTEPVATKFAMELVGSAGGLILSAAIMCSVFGALNGNLLVGPRVLYAMGEDRLVPPALGAIHARFHTPALAILATAAWSVLLILGVALLTWFEWIDSKTSHFDMLTNFAMFGALSLETLAITTIFIFRWTLPSVERPYRCWGYPVVPALYIVGASVLVGVLVVYRPMTTWPGLIIVLLGVPVYYLWKRRG